jgi:hypothetical protein
MPEFLTEGDQIEFRPDPGWQWAPHFDGVVAARPTTERPMQVLAKQVLVEDDLVNLAHQLEGKGYTTPQHPAPGQVAQAQVIVNPATLARPGQLLGKVPAVRTTEGTFQVICSSAAANPVTGDTDTVQVKTGTWKVKSVQQAQAQSVCEAV